MSMNQIMGAIITILLTYILILVIKRTNNKRKENRLKDNLQLLNLTIKQYQTDNPSEKIPISLIGELVSNISEIMKTKYRRFILENRKQRRQYLYKNQFEQYISEIAKYKEQNDALFDEGYKQIQQCCGFSLDELINDHYIPQLKQLDEANAQLKQIEFESISPKILRQEFKATKVITPSLFEEITQYQLQILQSEAQFFQQVVRYFSAFNSNIILILIQIICYDFLQQKFKIEEEDISNFLLENYKSKLINDLLEQKKQILKRILALDPYLMGQQEMFQLTLTETELIKGLKSKHFQKIGFMLGAGASVSAGIPDFRSKDGLYNQLEKYNLSYPEQIFSLNYFQQNPETFYKFCSDFQFLDDLYQPTVTHKFLKLLENRQQLKIVFTQNIDGLERKAGIPQEKVIQAHGNLNHAHCITCNNDIPISEFKEGVHTSKIVRCKCGGLVKPDIVFFEQQLPKEFFVRSQELAQCDLVFIIGTSLAVYPFAGLLGELNCAVPLVLINKDNDASIQRDNFLFLQGIIDDKINAIVAQI